MLTVQLAASSLQFLRKSLHVLMTIFGYTFDCRKLWGWGSVKTPVQKVSGVRPSPCRHIFPWTINFVAL